MGKRLQSAVRLLPAIVVFAATAASARPLTSQDANSLDVMFVGNSYTYFNNLPALVEGISRSLDGPEVRAFAHLHGGFSLRRHLGDGHVPGLLGVTPANGGAWDVLVIQEQSQLGVPTADSATGTLGDPASFQAAARVFVELARDSGTRSLLYMTWARKRFPHQTADLAKAYDDIGAELAVPVAPVGLAWDRVVRERPDLELYVADGSHPNPIGSYLAACVFYGILTAQSPEGGAHHIVGTPFEPSGRPGSTETAVLASIPADLALYLQRVAWETVRSRLD